MGFGLPPDRALENEIRAALKGKATASLKAMWQSNVVSRVPIGAVGPIKRKVPRRT